MKSKNIKFLYVNYLINVNFIYLTKNDSIKNHKQIIRLL